MTEMSLPVLCAVGAGVANMLVAVTIKGAEHYKCPPTRFGAVALTTAGLVSLIVACTRTGTWLDWQLWLLGVILGMLLYACFPAMVHANRHGPPSLPWAMCNLGLVVPIVLAAFFLDERLCWVDGLGLAAFIGMLAAFVLGTSQAKDIDPNRRGTFFLLLALVFLINGFMMFGFKLNSELPKNVNPSALGVIMYAVGSLLCWGDTLLRPSRKYLFQEVVWAGGFGLGNGASIVLLLVAMKLPAVVAFPTIQGISFLGGICATALVFRERLNGWKILGILLGLTVIFLSVLR
jgi:drug/metabolite transporter (DMT)-like permease